MFHSLLLTSIAVLSLGADDRPRELSAGDSVPKQEKERAKSMDGKDFSERLAKAVKDKRFDDAMRLVEAESTAIYCPSLPFDTDLKHPDVLRLAILVVSNKHTDKAVELGNKILKTLDKEGEVYAEALVIAIVDPEPVLLLGNENSDDKVRAIPMSRIDPALAKIAAAAADKASKDFNEDLYTSDFVAATLRMCFARAYQAAGEKKKAARELKKAAEVLDGIVHQANEAQKTVSEMQKQVAAPGEEDKPRK